MLVDTRTPISGAITVLYQGEVGGLEAERKADGDRNRVKPTACAYIINANEVVKANNVCETIIVLHGRVEDVEINEEVDVLISEWMGYMLLYESMLGSVITARDRWLKPGGLILPSTTTISLCQIDMLRIAI
ncbi:hypothetical protein POM88_043566 [Heracleum sosnowskyi]|uniref:Uncharacterized protein n=1 Tax=Heracleum sosnowskyi TaxID=360622 RepID=A0AAD8H197_9APIA|nr:hypothetical protein POM88_043566 [Heracleum sosnowskyi]